MEDVLVWNGRIAEPAPAKRGAVAGMGPEPVPTADDCDPPEVRPEPNERRKRRPPDRSASSRRSGERSMAVAARAGEPGLRE
jgi:hypothetical protein